MRTHHSSREFWSKNTASSGKVKIFTSGHFAVGLKSNSYEQDPEDCLLEVEGESKKHERSRETQREFYLGALYKIEVLEAAYTERGNIIINSEQQHAQAAQEGDYGSKPKFSHVEVVKVIKGQRAENMQIKDENGTLETEILFVHKDLDASTIVTLKTTVTVMPIFDVEQHMSLKARENGMEKRKSDDLLVLALCLSLLQKCLSLGTKFGGERSILSNMLRFPLLSMALGEVAPSTGRLSADTAFGFPSIFRT
ncbi:hypothetical protein BJ742DRAFT_734111 [Cladochytrium replicatum]|nr:hypothetical protein BJ742DRAFT_734111 [Cladochytrium replicatum]